jgi:hypothetical protein
MSKDIVEEIEEIRAENAEMKQRLAALEKGNGAQEAS